MRFESKYHTSVIKIDPTQPTIFQRYDYWIYDNESTDQTCKSYNMLTANGNNYHAFGTEFSKYILTDKLISTTLHSLHRYSIIKMNI
jgi:hypothetical protein